LFAFWPNGLMYQLCLKLLCKSAWLISCLSYWLSTLFFLVVFYNPTRPMQDTSWWGHCCFVPDPSWFCHQPPSIRYCIIFITDSIVNCTTKNNILFENIVCAYLRMFCWQHSKLYSDSSLLVISDISFLFLFHWW